MLDSLIYGRDEWNREVEKFCDKHLPKLAPAGVVEQRLVCEIDRYYRENPSLPGAPPGYYPTAKPRNCCGF